MNASQAQGEVYFTAFKYLSKNKLLNLNLVEWCSSIPGTTCAGAN